MAWDFELVPKKKPVIEDSVLIVGMPGIGNVGKVAADFLIDELKAKALYNIFSYDMPNSVFVNEKNLVELPKIEVFLKKSDDETKSKKTKAKTKGKKKKSGPSTNILILTGDVQPSEDDSSYNFCDQVLDMAQQHGVTQIITLGGIGLSEAPKKPQIYITGNSKKYVKDLKIGTQANDQLFGFVGPIIGVSGVLIGLAEKRKINAACLLAETLGHPAYIGIRGAKELLKFLSKKYKLGINIKDLDKEIEEIEEEIMTKTRELSKVSKKSALKKITSRIHKETSYIG